MIGSSMSEFKLLFNLRELQEAARIFLQHNKNNRWFAFYGGMGAGKTTFITALCKELKCIDLVNSPTFSIINEYQTENGDPVFHFDFYRINTTEELYDIGFEEYFDESHYCFIEWPEKAESLLDESFLKIRIIETEEGKRELSLL